MSRLLQRAKVKLADDVDKVDYTVIRIGLPGDPESVRKIKRVKLKAGFINRIFNCDIDYLQDAESGVTLLPADWESRCLPPPVLYNIIAKVWRDPDPDALEDDMYVGEVAIFVNEVPTEVPEAALHKWLSVGLDENADGLHEAKNQLKEVEEELVALELIIERFSMEPYDDSDEDERKKRQDRSMRLELGHLELLAKLLALQKRVEEAYATAPSSHPELFELKLDGPSTVTRQNFWLVRFQDSDSGKWFAYCAAHKMDWNATRLALNKVTGEYEVVRGAWPAKTDMKALLEINMRGVTVSRLKHGRGLYKFSDERGLYSGNWFRGLRSGEGEEISVLGRFQGVYEDDWKVGPGTHFCANGDTYRGTFGTKCYHTFKSLMFGDEYMDGLPNGDGKFSFVDGSEYNGRFENGTACGFGSYVTPTGIVQRGVFDKLGSLHGPGLHAHSHSKIVAGEFRHGSLWGNGVEFANDGSMYDGGFKHGNRDGFGVHKMPGIDAEYKGWFTLGAREGRGIFTTDRTRVPLRAAPARFGSSTRAPEVPVEPAPLPIGVKRPSEVAEKTLVNICSGFESEKVCEGKWHCGTPLSGGVWTSRHYLRHPGRHPRVPTMPFRPKGEAQLTQLFRTERKNAKEEEEMEREIAARHAEERLELEASYLGKFEKWNKGALAKFDERRAEPEVKAMHKELRALKKRQTGPNREIFGTEDKAAPMLRRLMETTAMSPDTRAKLMEVKKERMLKRDHERMEAVAKEHANKGSDEFLKKLME